MVLGPAAKVAGGEEIADRQLDAERPLNSRDDLKPE